MNAIKVRGPFTGPTGYDRMVRGLVRAFDRLGVAVELVDLPGWGPVTLPPHRRDPWFATLDRPTGATVALHCCMPHQVAPEPGRATVNFTMFEASRVPAAWVAANRRHDLLVLPTESSRRAWLSSGMPAGRIRLCPLGVDANLWRVPVEPLPLRGDDGAALGERRVRFLHVAEPGPRKNLRGLLRAWLRATTDGDEAVLILKLGPAAPNPAAWLRSELARIRAELGASTEGSAPVHPIADLFADAEMPRLFATATHYVSLSFGEGWDLPMLEAAASGLRLIAPDHSAYPAYLDAACARLIPSRETPVGFGEGEASNPLFLGASWWRPDEDAAVAAIRAAIEGHDAELRPPRQRVLRELTWERAADRLPALLEEVADRRARRRWWPIAAWSRR